MLFHPALAMFKDPLSCAPSLLYLKGHTHGHAGQARLMGGKLLEHINYLTFLRELGFYISSSLYSTCLYILNWVLGSCCFLGSTDWDFLKCQEFLKSWGHLYPGPYEASRLRRELSAKLCHFQPCDLGQVTYYLYACFLLCKMMTTKV